MRMFSRVLVTHSSTASKTAHPSFFSGDALAAPTHWFYGGERQVKAEYGHLLDGYTKPNHELPGSILNKSNLNGGGRSAYAKSKSGQQQTIIGDVINHGKKDLWSPTKQIHYHATLQAGEPTLEAQIARVLMKSIVANDGTFNANHFRQAYIKFMTTPGSHNDTYASTCHRMFFENLVHNKLPPEECPDNDQHNVDAIDGLILPTIAALASAAKPSSTVDEISKVSAECASVTRRSRLLEQTNAVWSQVVVDSLREASDETVLDTLKNVSKTLIGRSPKPYRGQISACYLQQSLPTLIDLVQTYIPAQDPWHGLLTNANAGGENVHRGSVLGAILGARAGNDALPEKLKKGLVPYDELAQEIDDFVNAVMNDSGSEYGTCASETQ